MKKAQTHSKDNKDDKADKANSKARKVDKKILKLIWTLIKPHRLKLILSIIILLISKGLIVFVPIGIKFGVDIIEGIPVELSVLGSTLFYSESIGLSHIAYFLLSTLLIQYGATYLQIYMTNTVGLNMVTALREKLFTHTIKQSLTFYNKNRIGFLLTRIVHDIQTLNELFVTGIPTIFGDLFLIVSIVIISFFIDVKLALVSLFILPFLYFGMTIFKKYSRKSFLELRVRLATLNSFLQSTVSGIKIVQAFNRQNKMFRIFGRIQKKYFMEYLRTVRIYSYYFPVIESFSVLSRVLLIVFGTYWISTGSTDLASVIAFLFFSPMFFHPLRELSEQYNVLQAAMASGEKIYDLLSTRQFIEDGKFVPKKDNKGSGIKGNISSFRDM